MAAAPEDVAEEKKEGEAPKSAKAEGEKADEESEQEEPSEPEPDPDSCKGLALSLDVFEQAVLDGEFEGTSFMFYLEPMGVLNANLVCARSHPDETRRAGILMTRAAWQAKTVFFDDGINPERYKLHFPKEFGYIKSIQHYEPESREHAKYPWSKKY